MFKKIALLISSLALSTIIYAQENNQTVNSKALKSLEKPSRDFVMLTLTYDAWANTPDSIKTKGFSRGVGAYLCYDFPINKSNLSFAAGIGVGVTNTYLDNQVINLQDTIARQAIFEDESFRNYKKYKYTATYIEAPFELRYFSNKENRNKGFKAAIGLRVGTLMGAHTKGNYTLLGAKYADKVSTKRYLENWRVAGTLRVGYGNFSVIGTYNFSNHFKDGQGPTITPYSVGIAITGL